MNHLEQGNVVALADVLVDVFDRVDRGADLDVEVALVLEEERRVVGSYVAVMERPVGDSLPSHTGTSTIIPSAVDGVTTV
jgi:hypothetical protein